MHYPYAVSYTHLDVYKRQIVWDEIAYEGNIDMGWGNISGQELTRRFWEASMRGGYMRKMASAVPAMLTALIIGCCRSCAHACVKYCLIILFAYSLQ